MDSIAGLSRPAIAAALTRAGRRDIPARAAAIQQLLRAPGLRQPPPVQAAYATIVAAQVALIRSLNEQIASLGEVVTAHFGQHPDAGPTPASLAWVSSSAPGS